jgi:DNA-binding FadR family transcriptional regulator
MGNMKQSNLLAETAARQLIYYIIDNDLPPKAKIPNEFELSQILKVGRSTVREAIKLLVSRNILEVRQGAGTFIVEQQIGISSDPLGLIFIKDKRKLIADLLEIRMMIEPRICSLAALAATPEDIAQMQTFADDVEASISSGQDHAQADIDLHTKIATASGNLVLQNLLPVIQRAVALFSNITQRDLRQDTIASHRAIVTAIRERNPVAASDAMIIHIVNIRNNVNELLGENGLNINIYRYPLI